MIDRVALKNLAKEQIRGRIGILFVIWVIVFGITFVAQFVPVVGPIVSEDIILPAFVLSISTIYLELARGIEPNVSRVFDGFYDLWCAVKLNFLVALFTFLWSLLLVVPGIIKSYSYSMSFYILAENKGISALEAIRRSKEMTEGHKMDLFVLSLSFIGWIILGVVTLGIGYIWIIPYMTATTTNYYINIKNQMVVESIPAEETFDATSD
jgi:uncharacterized membrane protein